MRSKNYDYVRMCYLEGSWSKNWVHDAIGHWITVDEFQLITGESGIEVVVDNE
jgi:hypothetical protein